MAYSHLALHNFRSYANFTVEFSPSVNIIVGPNGAGKTNLLEALYVLSQGGSFRVSDKDLVSHGTAWFRLDGRLSKHQRTATYAPGKTPPKQFTLDGLKKTRLTYAQKVPLVLFEPNELRMLSGSPQRRRDYLDGLVSRLWVDGGPRRSRFERALLQRNNIIKQVGVQPLSSLEDQLFVWDIKLAEYSAGLVTHRLAVLQHWNDRLAQQYSAIAGTPTRLEVRYKTDVEPQNYKADLLRQLTARRHGDIARGFTSVGPHRDDLTVFINGADAATSASRGELRTLMLSLKIIELQLLRIQLDQKPLLLLDDVFSELDSTRRRALAKVAQEFQTIITTTDADVVAHYFAAEHQLIDVSRPAQKSA